MKFIVLLPTYNKAENLPRLLSALFMQTLDISLLVVDDNSPDGIGYVFQIEMAYLMGFEITETPIQFADRRWGKSKMTCESSWRRRSAYGTCGGTIEN
ncbi:MAG TPA: glycosyltransferase [Anaerolineales bacterium]|nr:glycosyltransferase [Anaerolineales bacterium]